MENEFLEARVLVTGGAGFIGSHLVDALINARAKVRVLDNFSSGKHGNLAKQPDVEVVEGDIRNPEVCARACEGVTYVFHQAALGSVPRSVKDPISSMSVNVVGTVNVFTAARDAGVKRVVYASSSSVYGDSERLPKVEGEEGQPLSPYALSKSMNEQTAAVFAKCFDMEFIGLRYFNIYGPRQDPAGPYAAVIPRFMDAALAGEAVVIYGTGEQSRDFTYVKDAVRANMLAALAPRNACGRAYNVGAGSGTTVVQLAHEIATVVGGAPAARHEEARAGDVLHSQASTADGAEVLGFRAETQLTSGLAATHRAVVADD